MRLPDCFFAVADEEGRCFMSRCIEARGHTSSYRIGRSIEGRAIEMYKIGKGRGRVALFGAHHALERITSNILYAIIYILSYGLGTNYVGLDIALLHSLASFYIVPSVNPDGVELHHRGMGSGFLQGRQAAMSGGDFSHWQANARGVDLNHNYDYGFAEYKQLEKERGIAPGATLYSGEYPESEPETRAVGAFLRALGPDAVISLHTQGEEIYHSKDGKGIAMAGLVSRYTGYTCSTPTDTAAYGGLCDYTASLGIPSLTIEIGRGKNPLPQSAIIPALQRITEPLLLLPSLLV